MMKAFDKMRLVRILTACSVVGLAACSQEELSVERQYVPNSGSEQYPIRVVNGKAVTKPCGDWSIDATNSRSNELATNHGCAVQSNIAAMLARPTDYRTPRPTSPALASTRVDAVDSVDGNSVSDSPIAQTASSPTTGAPQSSSGGSSSP